MMRHGGMAVDAINALACSGKEMPEGEKSAKMRRANDNRHRLSVDILRPISSARPILPR